LDPLIRDALAWIVRLKSGEATLADAEQLIDWRARSPAHDNAFRDALKCWRAIGPALLSGLPVSDHRVGDQPTGIARRRRRTKSTSRS
jgi:ferric-dicitrate binding protein FerR (iron transport regulator)